MKPFRFIVAACALAITAFIFGDVSEKNGIAITTASTINGITPISAINGQTVAAGGFSLHASDDFESYSVGTTLASAANWTVTSGSTEVISGKVIHPNTGGNGSGAYYSGAATTTNTRVELTCVDFSTGTYIGITARYQTSDGKSYAVVTDGDRFIIDVATVGGLSDTSGHGFSGGLKIALEVTGSGSSTRLTVQIDTGSGWTNYNDGTTTFSNYDPATYLGAGYAGVTGYNNSTTTTGDDFKWYSY